MVLPPPFLSRLRIVLARHLRIAGNGSQPLADEQVAQRIFVMDAADLVGAILRLRDAI